MILKRVVLVLELFYFSFYLLIILCTDTGNASVHLPDDTHGQTGEDKKI